MKILTVYAHHNPNSFCHAVLTQFTVGLKDAGHTNEIVDLHAIRFDPVLTARDGPNWIDDGVPQDVLDWMHVREGMLAGAGGPVRRFLAKRWMGDRDARDIVRKIRAKGGPEDVAEQQRKVAWADALAFISPVFFVGFPAILKGWIERVFTLGFAFDLTPEAWRGDVRGRVPLLKHRKALILNTTLFDETAYEAGLKDAMRLLIDEFSFAYPGVERVEHVYFHAVYGADDARRQAYLDKAYQLGREFA